MPITTVSSIRSRSRWSAGRADASRRRRHGPAILAILLLGLLLAGPVSADPFRSGEPTTAPAGAVAEPGFLRKVAVELFRLQREVNRLITQQMVAVKEGRSPWALYIGMAIAFLYGAFHAAGPGHGKAVILSYFLSREARLARGLWMGGQIAMFHVVSALVIVSAVHFALTASLARPVEEIRFLRIASYGAILLMGLVMLALALRQRFRTGGAAHVGCGCHAQTSSRSQGSFLSFAVGLIPCSGAVLILVYALANGILLSGIVMTLSIAVGMAVTLSAIGILSILGRRQAVALAGRGNSGRGQTLQAALGLLGPLFITAIGAVLLAGTL